jgi:hypothetical protein
LKFYSPNVISEAKKQLFDDVLSLDLSGKYFVAPTVHEGENRACNDIDETYNLLNLWKTMIFWKLYRDTLLVILTICRQEGSLLTFRQYLNVLMILTVHWPVHWTP